MPRILEITVPPDRTDHLIASLRDHPGMVGLQCQRGTSLHPPGDVVTITIETREIHGIVRVLDEHGVSHDSSTSLTTSHPMSLVSLPSREALVSDTSEATWEEIQTLLSKEANPTRNMLALMAISGILAAIGLATSALHFVIAAMLIAPGFEPILRIGFGFAVPGVSWWSGVAGTVKAYAALIAGAAAAALVLRVIDVDPLGSASYLPERALVDYWTSLTWTSLIVATAASFGGAVLVASDRSVLTSGVMIALALIPGSTLVASGFVAGDFDAAGRGALRWAIDTGLVVGAAALVFWWKRAHTHQRESRL